MLNIDSIQNGIVIDHIQAGKGMRIYELLELDKLDCCVAARFSCGGRSRNFQERRNIDMMAVRKGSHQVHILWVFKKR